jgi:hypothetical protein
VNLLIRLPAVPPALSCTAPWRDEWFGVAGVSPWVLLYVAPRKIGQTGTDCTRYGRRRSAGVGPGEITWRLVTSAHRAELTPAACHSSASVLPPALRVRRSSTRSPTKIPPAAARSAWTPRPPTTATGPIQEEQALSPGYYVDLLRTWLLTRQRWCSGYGGGRQRRDERPRSSEMTPSAIRRRVDRSKIPCRKSR